MTRILTVECYGDLPTGWVPCISWPLPELGDGKVEDAPMLVPIGPQQWELRVAVRGAWQTLASQRACLGCGRHNFRFQPRPWLSAIAPECPMDVYVRTSAALSRNGYLLLLGLALSTPTRH